MDLEELKGKRIALIGLGVSNMALARFLASKEIRFSARDRKTREQLGQRIAQLPDAAMDIVLGESYLDGLHKYDVLFLTPGMRKDFPEILEAARRGAILSSEMTLFTELCRAPICGVTGSAGKTTTTTLIGLMLKQGTSKQVYVGGNIGTPLIESVDAISPDSIVVLELSSFQLQMMHKSPQVAVLLNISPNHLDIHSSMEEYVEAKKGIFRHQGPGDHLVVNADDVGAQRAARDYKFHRLSFSRTHEVDEGAFVESGQMMLRTSGATVPVVPVSEVKLPGLHNQENLLAAFCASSVLGCSVGAMSKVAREFAGVEHRLELVRVVNGAAYVNDSIATTPERTMAALAAVQGPKVLIAGGYDKHLPFDTLAQRIVESDVVAVITLGVTAPKIESAISREVQAEGERIGKGPQVLRVRSLQEAVAVAASLAKPGYTVLLSPACASYDMFSNFEERGRLFKELVWKL
ncbi:MAG: UDP-N-acetylmuramoyl-L-alanine--D-glutamate ligase [Bacillota bacterium]